MKIQNFITFFRKHLLYSGLTQENYAIITPTIHRRNGEKLRTFSLVSFGFFLFTCILALFFQSVADNFYVYLSATLLSFGFFVATKIFKPREKQVTIMAYFFFSMVLLMGILLSVVKSTQENTVTFFVLLVVVPTLFNDRPIRMLACIIFFVCAFIFSAFQTADGLILQSDVINAFIFGTLGMVMGVYSAEMKCKKYFLEYQTDRLSKTDGLTGLRNRLNYEQTLESYKTAGTKSVSCIYVDVNGLHDLNDKCGHDAGDAMLRFVANELQKLFGEERTYRIGGDEFVAFAVDLENDELERKLGELVVASLKEGYHVSVGKETHEATNVEISTLIKTAETRMYDAKRAYYRQFGVERSTRRH